MTVLPDSTASPLARAGSADATSAVSWGAILAGAAAAAALSLILLVLGAGLGLTAASPWGGSAPAERIGVVAIVWLALTAALASGLGGYIAGRLRTRWFDAHADEVHFRDTAHGLVAWSVATIVTAAVLTSSIAGVLDRGTRAAGAIAGPVAGMATGMAANAGTRAGPSGGDPMSYFTDSLFRRDAGAPPPTSTDAPPTAEVGRIVANGVRAGALPPDDARYAGQLVAQRTGLSQADAEKRVNDTFAKAKAAADDATNRAKDAAEVARSTAAHASFWIFFSLLIGAFSASFFAMLGGRQRDL
jgi:hypothetical protein